MTPATTLFAWICIRPVLPPFLYFPYAGLTILLYPILGYLSLLYTQLISFLLSLDYGSYDPCVPPSATRQRHQSSVHSSLSDRLFSLYSSTAKVMSSNKTYRSLLALMIPEATAFAAKEILWSANSFLNLSLRVFQDGM